jgi:uncharacterized membrane-anchored protein YhcB (DUF1043 family)
MAALDPSPWTQLFSALAQLFTALGVVVGIVIGLINKRQSKANAQKLEENTRITEETHAVVTGTDSSDKPTAVDAARKQT